MARASNYLENKLLDHALGTTAYTMPSQLYLALYSAAPSDAGGGTELTGNGYARQAVDFAAASGGSAGSDGNVTFTASGGDWSEATHWGLFDAVSSGNLMFHGPLPNGVTVEDGTSLTFPDGDIIITAD